MSDPLPALARRRVMRGSASAFVLAGLVLSFATSASAQHLETTPATVVDSRSVEIGYRALGTQADAAASEIGLVTGIAPAFDLGVVATPPLFATGAQTDAALMVRHLLHAPSEGPSLMLATGGGAARPLAAPPMILFAASYSTRAFAWHSNVGWDGEGFATTRVEGPLWWRLRPALELKQRALVLEGVGLGALMQVSDELSIDAGARFTEAELSPTFGLGVTYVLPSSELGA